MHLPVAWGLFYDKYGHCVAIGFLQTGMYFAMVNTNSTKMKNYALLLFLLIATVFPAFSQEQLLSPKKTAKGNNIEIDYGQPSKRNRVIFGELVPYGEVWRAGANEATELTLSKDAMFAGKPVKAGTYTLFAIPREKEWDIILNSVTKQWGAYEYDKIKAKNVLVITVPVIKLETPVEKLTYNVDGDAVTIEWDQTGVSIPVSFK
jgi:hypothetical protein